MRAIVTLRRGWGTLNRIYLNRPLNRGGLQKQRPVEAQVPLLDASMRVLVAEERARAVGRNASLRFHFEGE